jgi:hypothetical protein
MFLLAAVLPGLVVGRGLAEGSTVGVAATGLGLLGEAETAGLPELGRTVGLAIGRGFPPHPVRFTMQRQATKANPLFDKE